MTAEVEKSINQDFPFICMNHNFVAKIQWWLHEMFLEIKESAIDTFIVSEYVISKLSQLAPGDIRIQI